MITTALVAALVCSGGLVVAAHPSAAAGTTSTTAAAPASPQSQISTAEAQVAAIEVQIGQQQQILDKADEQYNQAVVSLSATQASLQATNASLEISKKQLAVDQARLREDAVRSYVYSTSAATVAELFAAPGATTEARATYEQVVVGNVTHDVAQVQATQQKLTVAQAQLVSEQQTASNEVAQRGQAEKAAQVAAGQAQATLDQVKGTLAQEVAAQAAQQAAAAAAAAAAAKTQAAARAAAAQAAQAAQVASAVGGSTVAATNANNSASQAATAVGATVATTGSGGGSSGSGGGTAATATVASGGSPQAAGIAAVHAAMQYRGVPYVWAGGTTSGPSGTAVAPPALVGQPGFDCSGLTMMAWAHAGVPMAHSAADQYAEFPHVSISSLEPGDLLFYDLDGSGIDHVVMYVGPTLDGGATAYGSNTIIQAAHTGTVVSFNPVWYSGLVGAARP